MEEQEKMVDEFDADLEQAELQEDNKEVADEEITAEIEGDLPPSMRLGTNKVLHISLDFSLETYY